MKYDRTHTHSQRNILLNIYIDLLQKAQLKQEVKAKNWLNHNKTSLKTTLEIPLFLLPSVLTANFSASGFPTLEQAT